jgi:hypothetical protein
MTARTRSPAGRSPLPVVDVGPPSYGILRRGFHRLCLTLDAIDPARPAGGAS